MEPRAAVGAGTSREARWDAMPAGSGQGVAAEVGVVKSGTGGEVEAGAGAEPGSGHGGWDRAELDLGGPVGSPLWSRAPAFVLGGRLRSRQSWGCVLPCSTWTGSWRCPRSPAPGTVRRRSWRCPGKGTRAAARTQKPERVGPGVRGAIPWRSCLSGLPALVSDCCWARALGERLKQLLDPKVPVCVTRSTVFLNAGY